MKPKSHLISITWKDDTESHWIAESWSDMKKSVQMNIQGCTICIPRKFCKKGQVKPLDIEA